MLFQDEDKMINLDGDDIKVVNRFSYLGDVLSTEGVAQEAVTSKIRSAWKKLKEVSNVICGRSIDAECWALKMEDDDHRIQNVPNDMWKNLQR